MNFFTDPLICILYGLVCVWSAVCWGIHFIFVAPLAWLLRMPMAIYFYIRKFK